MEQNKKCFLRSTKRSSVILCLCALILALCLPSVAVIESEDEWEERTIRIKEVSVRKAKSPSYYIVDSDGIEYQLSYPNERIHLVVPGEQFEVVIHASNNGIRAMAQGEKIIVDYEDSVSTYTQRDIWVWAFLFVGIIGYVWSLTDIFLRIHKYRKCKYTKKPMKIRCEGEC